MHIEMTRTYAADREIGFSVVADPERWSEWTPLGVLADHPTWDRPGDVIRLSYRSVFPGEALLEESGPPGLLRFTLRLFGAPPYHLTLGFSAAGTGAFTLAAVLDTGTPTGCFDRVRSMVLYPVAQHDLRQCLERLQGVLGRTT